MHTGPYYQTLVSSVEVLRKCHQAFKCLRAAPTALIFVPEELLVSQTFASKSMLDYILSHGNS